MTELLGNQSQHHLLTQTHVELSLHMFNMEYNENYDLVLISFLKVRIHSKNRMMRNKKNSFLVNPTELSFQHLIKI